MDESESLPINGKRKEEEEEAVAPEKGDEFYEKIEAPKFLDLTAPDPYQPGDDRYWFCLRVGCDQNHEEEMDSETIYKNFLLRVMAARSPNVRLRKALYRKHPGADVKCPRTVPAKPPKPRLALISSISKRLVDPKLKVKPLTKQNATPNARVKQLSVVAKALTTPRTKSKLSNPETFRSVRNPRATDTAMPKNRVVAKTLVFNSPKKWVRTKSSLELSTPVKTLSARMKKLEVTSEKKQDLRCNRPLPADAFRKQFRGREVKSRVFDGLNTRNPKGQETKSAKNLKKNKEENLQKCQEHVTQERVENELSNMETEEKTSNGSQGLWSNSKTEGNIRPELLTTLGVSKPCSDKNKVRDLPDIRRSDLNSADDDGDKRVNTFTSDDKENDSEVMESDDKENASASDDNRELNLKTSHLEHNTLGKHQTPKGNQKTTKLKSMQSKESSIIATTALGLKHKKPKPTNPKPFRLRTDERGILKEANVEKKLYTAAPLAELTSVSRILGRNLQKKHQKVLQRNEKGLDQTDNCHDTDESSEKEINRTRRDQQPKNGNVRVKVSKEGARQKLSSTPQKHTISSRQKLVVASHKQCRQENESALKLGSSLKKTKSPSMRREAQLQQAASSRKEVISVNTTGQLGTTQETSPTILKAKEAAKPGESGATTITTKVSASPASRPSLQGKRFTTIPKEPNFHSIHTPKSCTKRVA